MSGRRAFPAIEPAGRATRERHRVAHRMVPVETPHGFSFIRTVFSHGWFDLPPFHWEPRTRTLRYALRLAGSRPVDLALNVRSSRELRLTIESDGAVARGEVAAARRAVRRMLRLDERLDLFYARASEIARPDLSWTASCGAGRLLRAPGVFEDLVKMICTTNCGWPLTRVMVGALVDRLGEPSCRGARAFPAPEAMAAATSRFYREVVRAGYRAGFLRAAARRVADGTLDPESWADPRRGDDAVREEILSIEGAGPYVADNLMKLLGRYSGLGIDSWCRRTFSRMYARGRKVSDARIERFYAPFGTWRGLALWCDITREWFGAEGEERAREKFTNAAW